MLRFAVVIDDAGEDDARDVLMVRREDTDAADGAFLRTDAIPRLAVEVDVMLRDETALGEATDPIFEKVACVEGIVGNGRDI